ncbi:MAG: hypothetical protein M3P08_21235, partial [Thermoproteota archaeon]|nr:hypothetical protein [Thermoproteota archaeon]
MIRSFTTLSPYSIVGAIIFLLLSSTILTNLAFGQIIPKNQPSTPGSNAPSVLSLSTQPKPHHVKITTPTKEERVPVGKNLVISGTSAANNNATSINCQVSVIVNRIKPYQQATPTGPNAPDDYSKWSFTLTSKYTAINEGPNKITAKYACANSPSSLSHNSVNVTGVTTVATTTAAGVNQQQQRQQQPLSTKTTTPQRPLIASASAPHATGRINFLTYENSTYGIKIQHPSNWQYTVFNSSSLSTLYLPYNLQFLVSFVPQNASDTSLFSIETGRLNGINMTLNTIANGVIAHDKATLKDFNLLQPVIPTSLSV